MTRSEMSAEDVVEVLRLMEENCPSSKPDPPEFIGGFERLTIACVHAEADKQSRPGRPERTSNPYLAAFGIGLICDLASIPVDLSVSVRADQVLTRDNGIGGRA
jgi:hypothetical protein